MKAYTRRSFTAAGILATLGLTGCFNPADNRSEAVNGPAEDLERSSSSASSSSGSSSSASGRSDDYDPSLNEIEDVYGPPNDFDPSDNELEALYGPPEVFGGDAVGASGSDSADQDE